MDGIPPPPRRDGRRRPGSILNPWPEGPGAEGLNEAMGMEIFTIQNRLGLHARAAALLVKTANRFVANVTIGKDGVEVNGKSIMGILMLAASKGSKITVKVEGKDASQAMQTLGKLIEDKFGEE